MNSIIQNWLEDNGIAVDQGIQLQDEPSCQKLHHNSLRMKLYVKIPANQKTSVFEAKDYNIINDIKSMIHLKEGIQSNRYSLVYGGKLLQDYRTLASLSIRTESTLHMIFNPRDVMSNFVKTPSGKIVEFEVKVLYTIRNVKQIVESVIGCSVVDCSMVYEGNELQDFKTLALYNIEENSTLEVKTSWIQIFVKTWSGKTITLDVTRSSTVREVKDKIFCKVRDLECWLYVRVSYLLENALQINALLQVTTLRNSPLSTWLWLGETNSTSHYEMVPGLLGLIKM